MARLKRAGLPKLIWPSALDGRRHPEAARACQRPQASTPAGLQATGHGRKLAGPERGMDGRSQGLVPDPRRVALRTVDGDGCLEPLLAGVGSDGFNGRRGGLAGV